MGGITLYGKNFDPIKPKGERLSESSSSGAQLPEQFELLEQLGEGGMGVVYKARNKFTSRTVAIKTLQSAAYTKESLLRFQREAKATSAFVHPNAVSLFDFGFCTDGSPYFVMEFAEGDNLSVILQCSTRLDEDYALQVFIQVCDVLAHAHNAGVIHRDIKPSNIMINHQNQVKVLDFGIAKFIDLEEEVIEHKNARKNRGEEQAVDLTLLGDQIGTPLYMSPEQCQGNAVDPRADIYSFGAVMYHCLTGVPPHLGASAFGIMHKRMTEEPGPFKKDLNISPALEMIVHKCLKVEVTDRYQSAEKLLEELKQLNGSASSKALKTSTKKRTFLLAASCLTFFLLSAFAVWVAFKHTEPKTVVQPPSNAVPVPPAMRVPAHVVSKNLHGRILSDADWQALGKEEWLRNLQLVDTNLSDQQLHYLSDLRELIDLDVSNTDIRNVEELATLFPFLQKLRLQGLNLSGLGPDVLGRFHYLKSLDVSNTGISAAALGSVVDNQNLDYLFVTRSTLLDPIFSTIAQCKQLRHLNLFQTNTNDEKISLLAPLTGLVELRLRDTRVGNKALDTIAHFSDLTELDLTNCQIDDIGVAKLRGLKHLDWIGLGGTKITNRSLDIISNFSTLTQLGLRNTAIDDNNLIAFQRLQGLKHVYIGGSQISKKGRALIYGMIPGIRIHD